MSSKGDPAWCNKYYTIMEKSYIIPTPKMNSKNIHEPVEKFFMPYYLFYTNRI